MIVTSRIKVLPHNLQGVSDPAELNVHPPPPVILTPKCGHSFPNLLSLQLHVYCHLSFAVQLLHHCIKVSNIASVANKKASVANVSNIAKVAVHCVPLLCYTFQAYYIHPSFIGLLLYLWVSFVISFQLVISLFYSFPFLIPFHCP